MAVNGIEIQVGQTWQTRGGAHSTVAYDSGESSYPCHMSDGTLVTHDGKYWEGPCDSRNDLIELLSGPGYAAKAAPVGVNGIEIQLGQTWRMRDGQSALITAYIATAHYPWRTSIGTVTATGRDCSDGSESDEDLIELLSGPGYVTPAVPVGFDTWRGGAQPPETVGVRVEYQMGTSTRIFTELANDLSWDHADSASDIVAYRILLKATPLPVTAKDSRVLPAPVTTAPDLLNQAGKHMADRAASHDKPEGERSMAATVAAFNAQTGRDLTESEGWLLMVNLKIVRGRQRPAAHRDSVEDLVAYSALYGESRLTDRGV